MIRSPSPSRPDRTTTGVASPAARRRRSTSSPETPGRDRSSTTRVGPVLEDAAPGGVAVGGLVHGVPLGLELPAHHRPHARVVVHDQERRRTAHAGTVPAAGGQGKQSRTASGEGPPGARRTTASSTPAASYRRRVGPRAASSSRSRTGTAQTTARRPPPPGSARARRGPRPASCGSPRRAPVEVARRPLDGPTPRAEQHGRSTVGSRGQPHAPVAALLEQDPQPLRPLAQDGEAAVEVHVEGAVVVGGRARAHPQRQPVAADRPQAEDAVRDVDRVQQRQLDRRGAQLDVPGHRRGDGEHGERVRHQRPPADDVRRPERGEAGGGQPPGPGRDVVRRRVGEVDERGPEPHGLSVHAEVLGGEPLVPEQDLGVVDGRDVGGPLQRILAAASSPAPRASCR